MQPFQNKIYFLRVDSKKIERIKKNCFPESAHIHLKEESVLGSVICNKSEAEYFEFDKEITYADQCSVILLKRELLVCFCHICGQDIFRQNIPEIKCHIV